MRARSEPPQGIRAELAARLRQRFAEIDEAVFARVKELSGSSEDEDADYTAGLRDAVTQLIEYALTNIEQGEDWFAPIPAAAVEQARRAARSGVGLDTILRRYAAGDRLMREFVMDEADRLPSESLRLILREQGPHVDRLMATVASEYMEERESMRRSPSQRLAESVQRLLSADGPLDAHDLDLGYDLDAWHLGAIVTGRGGEEAARTLARRLGLAVLVVPRGEELAWTWLGGREPLRVEMLEAELSALPAAISLSVGEPRHGIQGWRLTHREAQAALEVALRKPKRLTRCRDVVLPAALLRDETLARSLLETYLAPLDRYGDFSPALRRTLRAYLDSGLNAATAAAVLKVDRHTVQRRLRKAEEALGCLLPACHAELEVALSLDELGMGHHGNREVSQRTKLARDSAAPGDRYPRAAPRGQP